MDEAGKRSRRGRLVGSAAGLLLAGVLAGPPALASKSPDEPARADTVGGRSSPSASETYDCSTPPPEPTVGCPASPTPTESGGGEPTATPTPTATHECPTPPPPEDTIACPGSPTPTGEPTGSPTSTATHECPTPPPPDDTIACPGSPSPTVSGGATTTAAPSPTVSGVVSTRPGAGSTAPTVLGRTTTRGAGGLAFGGFPVLVLLGAGVGLVGAGAAALHAVRRRAGQHLG
jgi:hypothetical protein